MEAKYGGISKGALVLALVSCAASCAQAEAADSQQGAAVVGAGSANRLAGVYYIRAVWDQPPGGGGAALPNGDEFVMLSPDGSLTAFSGTQNAMSAPSYFPTNSAGSVGSWSSHGGRVETRFIRPITLPNAALPPPVGSPNNPPWTTAYVGWVSGRTEGTVNDGAVAGRVHIDTYIINHEICASLPGHPHEPCVIRSVDGDLTMTRIDPAVGPVEVFQ